MSLSLAAPVFSDLMIKKSRFMGRVEPVKDRAQAQAAVDQLWQEHPDATHICWALLAGGHSAAVDDGEPGGTAGRPMLEVLRHHDLDGVLATVVRYFGGVKLGAGGLVRAYTDAVAQALLTAEIIEQIEMVSITCHLDYALEGRVRYLLEQEKIVLSDVEHGHDVVMTFDVPKADEQRLHQTLMDLSQGKMVWKKR